MHNTDISDEQLQSMSLDIDDFINKLQSTYGVIPLVATSVILARTLLANESVGTGNEYRVLLSEIAGVGRQLQ